MTERKNSEDRVEQKLDAEAWKDVCLVLLRETGENNGQVNK